MAAYGEFVRGTVDALTEAADRSEVSNRRIAIGRLPVLAPNRFLQARDAIQAVRWRAEALRAAMSDERRHEVYETIICNKEGAPYVARQLIADGRLTKTGQGLRPLAGRMQKGKADPAVCPGVAGLADDDWQKLDALVKAAPTP